MNPIYLRWQSFRENKFRHDCVSIELTKNGSNLVTYQGSGELWQGTDGILQFKCICRDTHGTAIIDVLNHSALEVGKLIPDTAYHSVQLVGFDNERWKAENVWLQITSNVVRGDAIVKGKIRTLNHVRPLRSISSNDKLRMLFLAQQPDDWRPLIGVEIRCDDAGCTIKISMECESDALVEVIGDGKLPSNFEVRIVEALRYVLGKVVHLSLIEYTVDQGVETKLISPVRKSEARLFPPLSARKPTPDIYRLFERYLAFVHSKASAEFVHPCSMYIRNACEASANSLEAEAIGLCVAVEGIANLLPFTKGNSEDEIVANVRQEVFKRLEEIGVNANLKERIQGLFSQLNTVRAIDRLQVLVQSDRLDARALDAWKKLRNKGVHPTSSKIEELDDEEMQKMLDRIHQVYVCMYQITFTLIGYEGAFSNYGSKRFREDAYPSSLSGQPHA
jgi:hypothetical protein